MKVITDSIEKVQLIYRQQAINKLCLDHQKRGGKIVTNSSVYKIIKRLPGITSSDRKRAIYALRGLIRSRGRFSIFNSLDLEDEKMIFDTELSRIYPNIDQRTNIYARINTTISILKKNGLIPSDFKRFHFTNGKRRNVDRKVNFISEEEWAIFYNIITTMLRSEKYSDRANSIAMLLYVEFPKFTLQDVERLRVQDYRYICIRLSPSNLRKHSIDISIHPNRAVLLQSHLLKGKKSDAFLFSRNPEGTVSLLAHSISVFFLLRGPSRYFTRKIFLTDFRNAKRQTPNHFPELNLWA